MAFSACSGSSGGGDETTNRGDSVTTLQGTLRSNAANARVLVPGEGGVPEVTVSALGSSSTTDENGNFTLFADGNAFAGGPVEFIFAGQGLDQSVVLDGVIGGPGAMAFVNFVVEDSGDISGESTDVDGNVLGTTPAGLAGCSIVDDFVDGGSGALWKPHSERTGTVVILMPPQYRDAGVEVVNSANQIVDGPLIRDCCSHNGGREHIYLTRTAGDLAGAGAPLTVRFTFSDGFVDCRSVPNPQQRYD